MNEVNESKRGWRIAWRQNFAGVCELWHTHGSRLYKDEEEVQRLCEKTNAAYLRAANCGTPAIVQWYEWYDSSLPDERRCGGAYHEGPPGVNVALANQKWPKSVLREPVEV